MYSLDCCVEKKLLFIISMFDEFGGMIGGGLGRMSGLGSFISEFDVVEGHTVEVLVFHYRPSYFLR